MTCTHSWIKDHKRERRNNLTLSLTTNTSFRSYIKIKEYVDKNQKEGFLSIYEIHVFLKYGYSTTNGQSARAQVTERSFHSTIHTTRMHQRSSNLAHDVTLVPVSVHRATHQHYPFIRSLSSRGSLPRPAPETLSRSHEVLASAASPSSGSGNLGN